MTAIKNIIERLGYSNSVNLVYPDSVDSSKCTNRIIKKIFNLLPESAIYLIDDKPFIVFHEEKRSAISQELVKTIWNFQIPLLFVCFDNRIEVYNGCSIKTDDNGHNAFIMLDESVIQVNDDDLPFTFWDISNPNY